ncbi:hypothetical protein [Plantibacter sp. VKM Ac-2876]|uniref:alpha-L-rhamnosidase-related protein n=1 Tax=Plantibacter sp. VKM Ac-2876 TaxID=2783826 RepID=UPI00188D16D0|nr:hypothetical protein [Plantibacter sp. VKM Ac-2876]MBF4563982.1 hypothetical protein [Plantibacter sp. VKM Ac-2876]
MVRDIEDVPRGLELAANDPADIVTAPGTYGRPAATLHLDRDESAFSTLFWLNNDAQDVDHHAGFRGQVEILNGGVYSLRFQAVSVFRMWVDDELVAHGPVRYVPAVPEFTAVTIDLAPGEHVLHFEAHAEGVMTRTTPPVAPFVWAELVSAQDHRLPIQWVGMSLADAYPATGRRVSPLLGWIEHQDLRVSDWRSLSGDDPRWEPVSTSPTAREQLGTPLAHAAACPVGRASAMRLTETGRYIDTYAGYVLDDPAVQFLLADPSPSQSDTPDGVWHRYDLGRIRIGAVELDVETEVESIVTIAYADRLTPDGRPSPVHALSLGSTAFLQRFTVPAGITEIRPLQTLGGRYIEVRVESQGSVHVRSARFRDRDLLGEPVGAFSSPDVLLNRIWQVGIETQRSAAEDSLVDSVRERGEWLGDVVTASLGILQSGWGSSDLARRAVVHAASAARSDGLVAGCGPGELIYLGTYAAQWTAACLAIARMEQSDDLLHQLVDVARANAHAVASAIHDDGSNSLPWGFVDWGYEIGAPGADVAVLAHALMCLQALVQWLLILDRAEEAAEWTEEVDRLTNLVRQHLPTSRSPYQSQTLAARAGVIAPSEAATTILRSVRRGFPFRPEASRLKNPTTWVDDAVTPYFMNYAGMVLLDAGFGEELRDIWRTGWGWMLEAGATTWWEVFDDRWSRCHAWSGSPTWQISQRVLGLQPAESLRGWAIQVNTLGLDQASGTVPTPHAVVRVEWTRVGDEVRWRAESDRPIQFVGEPEPVTNLARTLHLHHGDLFR